MIFNFWVMFAFGIVGTSGWIRMSRVSSPRGFFYCGLFTAAFFVFALFTAFSEYRVEWAAIGVVSGAFLTVVLAILTRKRPQGR